jgi:pimeloyl-ACP methyl ester carboxylesterase
MRTRTRTWRPHLEILEDRCMPSTFAAFGLDTPDRGPFPSDWFTVADSSQLTNRRIDLPLPDAARRPSDYADLSVINTLDGFNLQPRLSIPFSGPIDVRTVNSQTVFLIKLNDPTSRRERGGQVVGINQTVWDVATNTLHVESDQLLDQHTRYALIVTRGVKDLDGEPVQASEAFRRFRHEVRGEYKHDLLAAVHAAHQLGVREQDIVTASVFTTMSATAVLEKIRDQIHAATPAPADFLLGPGGTRTVFAVDALSSITFNRQTTVAGPLSPVPVSLSMVRAVPGAVATVAFGKYLSPDYQVHPGQYIPPVGTRTGNLVVQSMNEIYFNLFLPSGPEPAGGWPVALHTHGGPESKQGLSLAYVATMAQHGIATILINAVGRGFGPLGTLTVTPNTGSPVTFLAGGRSIDQNGDGSIGQREGENAAAPNAIIGARDAYRQTTADWMQLVRVIQAGLDVDGDGARDLDPSRISYFGLSWGGNLGALLLAVEPDVRAGVLLNPGALDFSRLSPVSRPAIGTLLQARVPSLINSPGLISIGGVPIAGPHFNENMPLRNQAPVINTVVGAMALQEFFDRNEWVGQSADPAAYAAHLRKDPLPGVPAKSVIIVMSKGDQTIPNPFTTAIIRAGDLADRTILYRNDLAFAEDNRVPKNPHLFPLQIESPVPLVRQIAFGVQELIATFLASDGATVIHPEPARFFEVPIAGLLPEDLNYIPGTRGGLGGRGRHLAPFALGIS